jgi:hypothetical protein
MFVHGEIQLGIGFIVARARLTNLTRGGWLLSAARGAYGEGTVGLAGAGAPGSVRGMSRLVQVYSRDLVVHGASAYLALRWEAAGPGGRLFPALDADLTLSPAGEQATMLNLDGVYRPPPATLDGELDQATVQRVAAATIRAFIDRVAGAVAVSAAAAAPGSGTASLGEPWPPASGTP